MDRRVGGHAVEKGDVVDAGGDVGEEIADPLATFAVLLELPARLNDTALVSVSATTMSFDGDGFAIHADHGRLVIEGVHVAGAAIHEQEDDRFRGGVEMRLLWGKRVDVGGDAIGSDGLLAEEAIAVEERSEAKAGEACAGLPEELAASAAAEIGGRFGIVIMAHLE